MEKWFLTSSFELWIGEGANRLHEPYQVGHRPRQHWCHQEWRHVLMEKTLCQTFVGSSIGRSAEVNSIELLSSLLIGSEDWGEQWNVVVKGVKMMKTPIQACTSSVYIHSGIGVLKCWSVSKNFATAIRLLFVGHFVPDGVKKFALVAWREYVLPTGISYQGIAFYNPSLKCEALLWIRWKRAWKSYISVWNRARVLAVFFKFCLCLAACSFSRRRFVSPNKQHSAKGRTTWTDPCIDMLQNYYRR